VWTERGEYRERVLDVALSDGRRVDRKSSKADALRNMVDLTTGKYANTTSAALLSAVWRDPQFNPLQPAVYYARVLEIPTPRWSTVLAIRNGLPLTPLAAATIQERAWSSPIWFTPAR
jgi:Protein of unknown function (DUF3604)